MPSAPVPFPEVRFTLHKSSFTSDTKAKTRLEDIFGKTFARKFMQFCEKIILILLSVKCFQLNFRTFTITQILFQYLDVGEDI